MNKNLSSIWAFLCACFFLLLIHKSPSNEIWCFCNKNRLIRECVKVVVGGGGVQEGFWLKPFQELGDFVSFRISMSMPSSRFIKAPSVQDTTKEGLCFFCVFFFIFELYFCTMPPGQWPFQFYNCLFVVWTKLACICSSHGLGECVFCLQCDSLVRLQSGFFFFIYYYYG